MKRHAIALVIALICWGYPAKTVAQEITAEEPKTFTGPVIIPVMSKEDGQINADINERTLELVKPVSPTNASKTGRGLDEENVSNGQHYSGKTYSKEEVQQLIRDYSVQYGIPAEVPLCIAKYESGYNHLAANRNSSAKGVFQYLNGTWKGTDEGRARLSVFDADANVRAAIKYMASRRSTQPWEVRHKCPNLSSFITIQNNTQ